MKKIVCQTVLLLCAALSLTLPAVRPAWAQPPQSLDVVLAIDNSGSMGSNDPQGLRWSAAQLFVDLANVGDRIAAYSFADSAEPLGEAANGNLASVLDTSSRLAAKAALAPRPPDGYTNMEDTLRQALDLLQGNDTGNRQVIVFLTDGKPEPEGQRPALSQLIQQAGNRGITIFPILLGAGADKSVADQMVRDTGGLEQSADNANLLLRAFGRIYTYIRPERYADEISIADARLNFRTNPAQAITQVSIVVPRLDEDATAIPSASLDDQELVDRRSLSNGAEVFSAAAKHYELITVIHNVPLAGEWAVRTGVNTSGSGLLIASSATTLELLHPVPIVAGSFVAPRRVPVNEPTLLVARVLQNGSELGDVPLSIATETGEAVAMDATGLSTNQSLAWRMIDLGLDAEGAQRRIAVQVGAELSPFRLRKELVIEGANVPPLIVDSPTLNDSGLVAGGKLRIAAHFEGDPVSSPQMVATISDLQSGHVEQEIRLQCSGNDCQDQSFAPQAGRSYQIIMWGTALHQGQSFSDGARTELITSDLIRVEGLKELGQLPTFAPGSNPAPLALQIAAFLQTGQPDLAVQITDLQPVPSGTSMDVLNATLSTIIPQGSNSYVSRLSFIGFDRLPPDAYKATLLFSCPSAPDVLIQPSRQEFQFRIAQPEARLTGLPNPLGFGTVPDLRVPQVVALDVTFEGGPPFDIVAQMVELTSSRGRENTELIHVDVDRPTGTEQEGHYGLVLRLSALQPLRSGEYRGRLLFVPSNPANVARIVPGETVIVFSIPEPSLILRRISLPGDPVGCPGLSRQPPDGDMVDFGALCSLNRTVQIDVTLDPLWIPTAPLVQAEILSLRSVRSPDGLSIPARLETGALQRADDGAYVLSIMLELPEGQRPGAHVGKLLLKSPGISIQPAELRFRFEARHDLWGNIRQWARPAGCFVRDWLTLVPFPRFKGLVGWILLLVGAVILAANLRPRDRGLVQPKAGPAVSFTSRNPVYVVPEDDDYGLSRNANDAVRAVVEVSVPVREESLDDPETDLTGAEEEAAWVRPGLNAVGLNLSYWGYSRRRGRQMWLKVPVEGKRLHHEGRFSVRKKRDRADRHEFTIFIED